MNIPMFALAMQVLRRPFRGRLPPTPATPPGVEAATPSRRVRQLVNGDWVAEIRLKNGEWAGINALHVFAQGSSDYYLYAIKRTREAAENTFKDWDARNGMGAPEQPEQKATEPDTFKSLLTEVYACEIAHLGHRFPLRHCLEVTYPDLATRVAAALKRKDTDAKS